MCELSHIDVIKSGLAVLFHKFFLNLSATDRTIQCLNEWMDVQLQLLCAVLIYTFGGDATAAFFLWKRLKTL